MLMGVLGLDSLNVNDTIPIIYQMNPKGSRSHALFPDYPRVSSQLVAKNSGLLGFVALVFLCSVISGISLANILYPLPVRQRHRC